MPRKTVDKLNKSTDNELTPTSILKPIDSSSLTRTVDQTTLEIDSRKRAELSHSNSKQNQILTDGNDSLVEIQHNWIK